MDILLSEQVADPENVRENFKKIRKAFLTVSGGGGGIYPGSGTAFTTYAKGDLIYASADDVLSRLPAGTDGYVLTMASGVPAWAAAAGGSSLPSMTGNSGKFLTNDGTTASWGALTGWATTGNAGTTSANYLGTSDAQPLQLGTNGVVRATMNSTNGNMLFGANTGTSVVTATPFNMSFGNSYGNNTPGSNGNLKWTMWENGTSKNGIGMSSALMELQMSNPADAFGFFVSGTKLATISSSVMEFKLGSTSNLFTFFTGATQVASIGSGGIVTTHIDTGATVANSKISLYNSGSFQYGLGIQSAQFRFYIDSSTSRYSFLDNITGSNELFTIKGTGQIGIMNSTPNASALLDMVSTTKGFLPSRMTLTQWNAIPSKAEALQGWNLTDHGQMWYDGTRTIGFRYNGTKFQGYDGTAWVDLN